MRPPLHRRPLALGPRAPDAGLGAERSAAPRAGVHRLPQAVIDCLSRPGRMPLLLGGLRGDDHLAQLVGSLAAQRPAPRETPWHPDLRAGQAAVARPQRLAASGRASQPRRQPVAPRLAKPDDRLPAAPPTAQLGPPVRR
ncbi:MAG: hypothetical protein M5U01_00445 [Ardenticatenaceae bacterium]|nr:hypothetical protein [Ardenticatenaceae bacterium]